MTMLNFFQFFIIIGEVKEKHFLKIFISWQIVFSRLLKQSQTTVVLIGLNYFDDGLEIVDVVQHVADELVINTFFIFIFA